MIKHFFAAITGNIISLIGTVMMVLSLLFILALLVMQAMGFEGGAYLGIVTFVLLPVGFLTGVAIVPLGLWLQKRRDARAAAEGRPVGHLPVVDLNKETTRGVLLGFTALLVAAGKPDPPRRPARSRHSRADHAEVDSAWFNGGALAEGNPLRRAGGATTAGCRGNNRMQETLVNASRFCQPIRSLWS